MVRKTHKEWKTLVSEYETSGVSQAVFATKHGLNVGTFQSWLYRIRKETAAVSEPTFIEITNHGGVTVRFRGLEIVFDAPPSIAWLSELASS